MVVAEVTTGLAPDIAGQIERLLAVAPDPVGAMRCLARLRAAKPAAFEQIAESRAALHYLITTFAYSEFLSKELMQNPQWILDLPEREDLHRVCRVDEYVGQLQSRMVAGPGALTLALFRRESILRIAVRDVLGMGTLPEITAELSNLADAILEVAYTGIRGELVARFGQPVDAETGEVAAFSVIALGKLGGCELNYSSDIDLMFLYSANGDTDGPQPIANKVFFQKLANQLTVLLSTYTSEGVCYRVDLRLRPEGTLGEVAISLEGARNYYHTRARDWELQMLIKARVAAGDSATGRALLDSVEPRIYSTSLDFTAIEHMSATRDRIDDKLAARRGGAAFDVKLARGGIRDIEFLVQCLQRLHGGRVAWVRHGSTLLALLRLQDKNLLSPTEYWRLASAYEFLRHLEHRLQIDEDRQTHTLPRGPAELDLLARRMPSGLLSGEASRERLLHELNAHLEHVVSVYERVIHAHKPIYYTAVAESHEPEPQPEDLIEPVAGNLLRSLDDTAPALAAQVTRARLKRGLRAFEHFLERATGVPDLVESLNRDTVLAARLLDIFEHSPYFAEEFIREPDLIFAARGDAFPDYDSESAGLAGPAGLRQFFRREMVRIQSASICGPTPIFETLGRTSDLADATVAAAYRMAVQQVVESKPPNDPAYPVSDQLMVIALGRLGMREFDLASDADLVFVLPDADADERLFWTAVAERTIEILTAYTGGGVVFAVDTRLRPNGREGALVQTAAGFREYFGRSAEAWEGMAYMKSRAVAGNMDTADKFLHELQEFDWRRYGQSGRSRKDLREMRMRLEREQGAANPLKAGYGGFYDLDFALMYLRLKGAGMFFKVLNTPERIDVLEKMGHLDRDDAEFLRDAAAFYRSLDHALRVFSGQAEGSLPKSEAKLAALRELLNRWVPESMRQGPLPNRVARIKDQTRQLFDRLFA